MKDKVDVLIIGSGASGAAVAWSLAETRMRIVCLEQGDWMKQSDYPTNGRDYEARVFSDYATSPNIRQRPSDYPINDDNSPIKVVNFNAVGGSTVMYTAHSPTHQFAPIAHRTRRGAALAPTERFAALAIAFAQALAAVRPVGVLVAIRITPQPKLERIDVQGNCQFIHCGFQRVDAGRRAGGAHGSRPGRTA